MGNNTSTYLMDYVWTGWHLHMFFGFAALVGVILFVTWALRELKGKDLKKWAFALILIGVLGALLTTGFAKKGWTSMWEGKNQMMNAKMMQGGMQMMGGQSMMQNGQPMMGGQSTTIVK